MRRLVALLLCGLTSAPALRGQGVQPAVAIHDSELTRALETVPASGATPTGSGTTGFQWWPTDWHYFVMPDSLREALRSDGTAFTVVGDSNITAGALLVNGQPKYPILISLAAEAIRDDEIGPLTNYVAAGGFLFVGSSAFTRYPDGTGRGDFAIAAALGVHSASTSLANWGANNYVTRQQNNRITAHLPSSQLTWRMPSSSEEICWGITPSHPFLAPHDLWRVTNGDATVLATGDSYPFLTIKRYGQGYFIYHAAFQPLIGHGGFAPGMYAYVIFRRAIEWAFEASGVPIPKLSPWPYKYDAAFIVRHDLENFAAEIANIEASAQVEYTNGAKGDYYFVTGTLREDMSGTYNTNTVITSLRRAISNYGATIGPHNGGLKNPDSSTLVHTDYDYWHWGPDEALDVTPSGYPSGKAYAAISISNAFLNIEGWFSGLTNGIRSWVSPYFNATREDSYDLQNQLKVKVTGDQKLTPFPHWTVSTRTAGKLYPHLSEPTSDWFVGGLVAQSLEPWHPPGVHTTQTLHDGIDSYYSLGGLINFYSHTLSTGQGDAGQLVPESITYCMNTNLHPRLWPANAVSVYQWWVQRSNAQVTATFSPNGSQSVATLTVKRATDTNTAVELLLPTNSWCNLQVQTNGVAAAGDAFRLLGQLVRVRVGTTVTNVAISYWPLGPGSQVYAENFDGVAAPGLPPGWTTSASGAQSPWVSQTATRDTAPNALFSPDATNAGLNELVSPPIALPAGSNQLLIFRNSYDLESSGATIAYDGGVLEIKIGAGGFVDILAAGGAFADGGYTGIIDATYGNPLAGRRAWTGNSGGFITTTVNLPASAAGQTVQFRWRCGTDNSNGKTGWRIDTLSVSNLTCLCCVTSSNSPPSLPSQANLTVNEMTLLTVTNTATDPDPSQTLAYQLLSPPAGASIDASGIISWTPTEAQGPGSYSITTVVSDSGSPPLTATNSFTVVVNEVNRPPVLPSQANRTIAELSALVITNTATDPDLPPNTLSYVLLNPPAGAAIDATGRITWTPSEAQGPSTNTIRTVVTDNGSPPLSATNTFTVVVTEVNTAPVLSAQPDRTVSATATLVVTNTATDADIPPNILTYILVNPPAGAVIDANGVITWSAASVPSPSSNSFVTVVTDNGIPPLSATNSFRVFVAVTNSAPVLPTQADRTIVELSTLAVTNTATDPDPVTYTLVAPPAGATIDTNGIITWTPTEVQGPSTNTFRTIATDSGSPALSATNAFTVVVTETNSPPVLPPQPDRTVAAGTTLLVTNTAIDPDIPTNTLRYALSSPPAGAGIDASGIITWTLPSTQAPGAYTIRTIVTDNGIPPMSDTNAFTVNVLNDTNPPAIISPPASQTVAAGAPASFSVTATGAALAYQWRKGDGNLAGATSSAYSIAAAYDANAGSYSVVVTNVYGAVTSSPVLLTVIDPPVVLANPVSRTNLAGTTATFTVGVGGTAPFCQWRKQGSPLNAQTNTTLTLLSVSTADEGAYDVVLSNLAGTVTSAAATLTVITAPSILADPVDLTNFAGMPAAFQVTVSGTAPQYQWFKNGTNALVNNAYISGANTDTLSFAATWQDDAGAYSVVVTNLAGSATSAPALLTITTNILFGALFADDFTRAADPGPLSPWVSQAGNWTVTGGALRGTPRSGSYGFAYVTAGWTNYSVQADIQLGSGAYGGGLGGRVNAGSGTHYEAFILPENSPGGSRMLQLLKFKNWKGYSYGGSSGAPMRQVSLPAVGTSWHTLKLTFSTNRIVVWFDGVQLINMADTESTTYATGGIATGLRDGGATDTIAVDNVIVLPLAREALPFGPPPVIQSVAVTNGTATLSWTTVNGATYRVQYLDDLASGQWFDVVPDLVAAGSTLTATNSTGSAQQRFYRVVLVP